MMTEYPDQPGECEPAESDTMTMDELRTVLDAFIRDALPVCSTNDWFIDSVYFANMLDKIVDIIWENV